MKFGAVYIMPALKAVIAVINKTHFSSNMPFSLLVMLAKMPLLCFYSCQCHPAPTYTHICIHAYTHTHSRVPAQMVFISLQLIFCCLEHRAGTGVQPHLNLWVSRQSPYAKHQQRCQLILYSTSHTHAADNAPAASCVHPLNSQSKHILTSYTENFYCRIMFFPV